MADWHHRVSPAKLVSAVTVCFLLLGLAVWVARCSSI